MESNRPIAIAPKRRQARGERRVEEILDAAERVFVRIGYARTTTNHIAAEAKASPATLYHFFENKAALAEQLASRYAKNLIATHQRIHLSTLVDCGLPEMIENIVDTFLDLHRRHPALKVIFDPSAVSTETMDRKNELDLAFRSRLADLFQARGPAMSREDAFWAAQSAPVSSRECCVPQRRRTRTAANARFGNSRTCWARILRIYSPPSPVR